MVGRDHLRFFLRGLDYYLAYLVCLVGIGILVFNNEHVFLFVTAYRLKKINKYYFQIYCLIDFDKIYYYYHRMEEWAL